MGPGGTGAVDCMLNAMKSLKWKCAALRCSAHYWKCVLCADHSLLLEMRAMRGPQLTSKAQVFRKCCFGNVFLNFCALYASYALYASLQVFDSSYVFTL